MSVLDVWKYEFITLEHVVIPLHAWRIEKKVSLNHWMVGEDLKQIFFLVWMSCEAYGFVSPFGDFLIFHFPLLKCHESVAGLVHE